MDLLPANITETPGMMTVFWCIVVMHLLSIVFLVIIVRIFRTQSRKYQSLMSSFGGETWWGTPGRILIPLYIMVTVAVAVISLFLFLVQPHLL